ncbi:MAG: peptide/nickel transport system ATP-binding protein, partial [Gaiellaceae bacterium]|nr:peptide/nickel transport system ATP-binding protein [Gaiellaceae bacterium]
RPPGEIVSGRILFKGEDAAALNREELRRFRWRNISLVFQSAMDSLNPVMRVGNQFVDMLRAHQRVDRSEALARAGDLLELVGIDRGRVRAYPHELSGGMRQRVVIAMALALRPELIVMDEPTTALDVVVQREILQEIEELKRELGCAVLFLTPDLSLLVEFSDRIAIMYAGEIVESAPADDLFKRPEHPYTVGLMSSFPPLHGPIVRLTGIPGSPPDLANPPTGCRFHPRCPHCSPDEPQLYARQRNERPELRPIAPEHLVACHLAEERP